MSNWEERRFEEIIEVNPITKLKKGNEYAFIDIDKVSPILRTVSNVETKTYDGQSCSKFCKGDTVFSRITPCLENRKIAQVDIATDAGFGSTEFYVFRARENEADKRFVYYLGSSDAIVLPAINSMTGASGRQRADKRFIERLKITVPDLPTQKRIADVLSAYDDLIENNNKRIALLEKAAQELYKEWFVRFRFLRHEKAKFVNGLPEGWERKKISEYYDTSSGGTPSRSNEQFYINGNIPWIKTGEVKDTIIIDTEEHITDEAVKHSSAKLIPAKSVIMAMYGVNIGMLGYVDREMTCNQACCVFADKREFSTRHYLYQYLMSIREYLLLISFGAAQQNVSQELIKKIKIVMPTDDVVIEYEKKIDTIYNSIRNLMYKNKNLIKQRDLLLPRLMSGKLKVDIESNNERKESNKIISFEQFKQQFKFAARANNALSDDDVKNLYEAYCNDKCKKE